VFLLFVHCQLCEVHFDNHSKLVSFPSLCSFADEFYRETRTVKDKFCW